MKRLFGLALFAAVVLASGVLASNRAETRARIGDLLKESGEKLAAGQYDSVLVRLEKVREIDPKNADAIYYTALVYLAESDTARARDVLSEGLETAPLSGRVRLLLVRLQLDAGDYEDAEVSLMTLLRFKPNDAEALYLRGFVGLARGDTVAALDDWEKALEKLRSRRTTK